MINTQMFGVLVQAVEEIRQTVLKTAIHTTPSDIYHFVSCSSTKYYCVFSKVINNHPQYHNHHF